MARETGGFVEIGARLGSILANQRDLGEAVACSFLVVAVDRTWKEATQSCQDHVQTSRT